MIICCCCCPCYFLGALVTWKPERSPGMSDVSHLSGISVIWFPFPSYSLVFLPSPLALCVLSFFCQWSILLTLFRKLSNSFLVNVEVLLYVHRNRRLILGTGAQDGHLDFYTAPELWNIFLLERERERERERGFEMCTSLWPEFDLPEVTQCGWQDIKIQLLTTNCYLDLGESSERYKKCCFFNCKCLIFSRENALFVVAII